MHQWMARKMSHRYTRSNRLTSPAPRPNLLSKSRWSNCRSCHQQVCNEACCDLKRWTEPLELPTFTPSSHHLTHPSAITLVLSSVMAFPPYATTPQRYCTCGRSRRGLDARGTRRAGCQSQWQTLELGATTFASALAARSNLSRPPHHPP